MTKLIEGYIQALKEKNAELTLAVQVLLGDKDETPYQHYTDRVKFARAVLARAAENPPQSQS